MNRLSRSESARRRPREHPITREADKIRKIRCARAFNFLNASSPSPLRSPTSLDSFWQRCQILPIEEGPFEQSNWRPFVLFDPSTRSSRSTSHTLRWPKGNDEAVGHAHSPSIPIAPTLLHSLQCRRIFIPARGQPLACSPALS